MGCRWWDLLCLAKEAAKKLADAIAKALAKAKEEADAAKEKARLALERAKEKAKELARKALEKAKELARKAEEKAKALVKAALKKAKAAAAKVKAALEAAKKLVAEKAEAAKEALRKLAEEKAEEATETIEKLKEKLIAEPSKENLDFVIKYVEAESEAQLISHLKERCLKTGYREDASECLAEWRDSWWNKLRDEFGIIKSQKYINVLVKITNDFIDKYIRPLPIKDMTKWTIDAVLDGLLAFGVGIPWESAVSGLLASKSTFLTKLALSADDFWRAFRKLSLNKKGQVVNGLSKLANTADEKGIRNLFGLIKKAPKEVEFIRNWLPVSKSIWQRVYAIGIKNPLAIATLAFTLSSSYPFSTFIREESFQAVDFAFRTAEQNKDVEGMEEVISIKEELLERTTFEKLIFAIPLVNLLKELWDYFNVQIVKLKVDRKTLERVKAELGLAVIPEIIKVRVRDIIDGDTIDVSLDIEGSTDKLPEYGKTNHARIRLVGINTPEKSPKGEILCSDVEIEEVEPKYADLARDRLRYLNDKTVTLYVDPDNSMGSHGRILAKVVYQGKDINLDQIETGHACGYYRGENKYVDVEQYKAATLKAMNNQVGMWKEFAWKEFKIKITSEPSNAKLYIDDTYTGHLTPSDEEELSDVLELLTEGSHTFKATKTGMEGTATKEITVGDNGTVILVLKTPELEKEEIEEVPPEEKEEVPPEEKEELDEERPPEDVEEVPETREGWVEVEPEEIPAEFTADQSWALSTAFNLVYDLSEGAKQISEEEYDKVVATFDLYTIEQKVVLDLFFRDVWILIKGKEQLTTDEFQSLEVKYRTDIGV